MKRLILIPTLVLSLSGCASLKDSLIAGAGAGAATGGLIGNASGKNGRSTLNGALIGAAIGAGISYLGYKDKKKKTQEKQVKALEKTNDTPLITQPKIKRIWVEDKISGKRFIKGHWEFVIEENSEWSTK